MITDHHSLTEKPLKVVLGLSTTYKSYLNEELLLKYLQLIDSILNKYI